MLKCFTYVLKKKIQETSYNRAGSDLYADFDIFLPFQKNKANYS